MLKSEINFSDFLDTVKDIKILNELGEKLLKSIADSANYINLTEGEILFNKAESYHKGIYLIINGEIRLIDDAGNILEILGKGGLAGLTTFLGKSSYVVTGVSVGQSTLLFIPEITIYKLINESEAFSKYFYSVVNDRLHLF
ncbi:MAG: cyclic nucleotide-binding domain-containing protein, partial [Deferribacterales bacterium]|nr:cyclic nucleotide-binding domain-containing protein [Deferribacterales bacterium]